MKITPIKCSSALAALCLVVSGAPSFAGDATESQTLSSIDNHDVYVLEQTLPNYPETMLRRGMQGKALVKVSVSETGDIMQAVVVAASQPEFGSAALDAVSNWLFEPGSRNGVSVAQTVMVPVDFMIEMPPIKG